MYQHLNRTQLLKKLQEYEVYKQWTQKSISEKVGNSVFDLRNELKRLEDEIKEKQRLIVENKYKPTHDILISYNIYKHLEIKQVIERGKYYELEAERMASTFDNFENLPLELQLIILSHNHRTQCYLLILNKTLRQSTTILQYHYSIYSNLSVSAKEVNRYIMDCMPDKMMYCEQHINCLTSLQLIYDNEATVEYYRTALYANHYKQKNTPKILPAKETVNYRYTFREGYNDVGKYNYIDLINLYQIYKRRNYDIINPSYVKNKILESLTSFYDITKAYPDRYAYLVQVFRFFSFNLKQFGRKRPKNIYEYCKLNLDEPLVKVKDQKYTREDFVAKISNECEDMYNEVVDIITHLY